MTLSRKALVIPLAGLVLAGAAGAAGAAAAASSGTPATGTDGTVTPAAESPSPTASADTTTRPERAFGFREDGILSDVLDDLVADGTITEDQQQAILDGLAAERDARIAAARERADQLRSFLEDGVITQEEFDQLPEDSRLRQLAGIMDDGQITTEELRALGGGRFGGRGHGFGHGFGPRGFGWDKEGTDDVDPTPTPSAGTGG